jgi:hypothetical protein
MTTTGRPLPKFAFAITETATACATNDDAYELLTLSQRAARLKLDDPVEPRVSRRLAQERLGRLQATELTYMSLVTKGVLAAGLERMAVGTEQCRRRGFVSTWPAGRKSSNRTPPAAEDAPYPQNNWTVNTAIAFDQIFDRYLGELSRMRLAQWRPPSLETMQAIGQRLGNSVFLVSGDVGNDLGTVAFTLAGWRFDPAAAKAVEIMGSSGFAASIAVALCCHLQTVDDELIKLLNKSANPGMRELVRQCGLEMRSIIDNCFESVDRVAAALDVELPSNERESAAHRVAQASLILHSDRQPG